MYLILKMSSARALRNSPPSLSKAPSTVALEPPGEICFQTAWQDTSIARRQVPLMPLTYKYRLAL
ncbi:hypothetical protein DEO72_LG5g1498 [Vigna unguiculata]|uniref:Uncharacterized protein n=1 Tax=Vigna unguiculata TaxID=3917 RepID=A0A4D6LY56_VIGUN|nr:hypothetical protein DEO72_LG5g1498 [Vigna unguiculata]